MKSYKLILLLSLSFYGLYFCLSSGVTCSNDGGHIGLAKAMYYDHQVEVGKYFNKLVSNPDYAVKDGRIYSDRLPGTAMLMVPAFAYADVLSYFGLESRTHVSFDIVVASLLPALFGALSVLLLYLFLVKVFNQKQKIAAFSSLVYGLCTLAMLEATHLFSHAFSLFFVSFSVYIIISMKPNQWKIPLYLSTAILGFSMLIELQNILFILPIFLYTILKNKTVNLKLDWLKPSIIVLAIIGFFMGLLLWYNYLAFDELLLKSNKYNPNFPEEASFFTSLSGDFLKGIDRLYTNFLDLDLYTNSVRARYNDIPGLFVTSPVYIFSVVGFLTFYKSYRLESYLFLTCILISTIVAALHVTTLVRHIHTINLLLFIPFAFYVQNLFAMKKSNAKNIQLVFLFLFILISFLRVTFSSGTYWGRSFAKFMFFSNEILIFLIANIPLFILILWKRKKLAKFFSTDIT